MKQVSVMKSGDDGIQLTEIGEGQIEAELKDVIANDNKKYGIKMEQWVIEDEKDNAEDAGKLELNNVSLSGNGKGDEIKVNNIITE